MVFVVVFIKFMLFGNCIMDFKYEGVKMDMVFVGNWCIVEKKVYQYGFFVVYVVIEVKFDWGCFCFVKFK